MLNWIARKSAESGRAFGECKRHSTKDEVFYCEELDGIVLRKKISSSMKGSGDDTGSVRR